MSDNNYIEEPVVVSRVTETSYTAPPVYEAVEPTVSRPHPGLLPLALSSLLGLLSMFLPFFHDRLGTIGSVGQNFSMWGFNSEYRRETGGLLGNIFHTTPLLLLLLGTLALGLIGFVTRAVWARYLAAALAAITGIWLLWHSLFHFGRFSALGQTVNLADGGISGGFGRWIMALAGLGLLATALWSLLGKVRDAADGVVGTGYTA